MRITITMDYSNLFLSHESIENVLKISQKPKTKTKSIGKGFASLVKSGGEKDAVQECKKCEYKTARYDLMYQHNRRKHSDIKHKCTECEFTNAYRTKVKTHHKQVHLGIPRPGVPLVCRKDNCENSGKSDCLELSHFRNFCDQCEFSSRKLYDLKSHTKITHEGFTGSFPCAECDFSTDVRDSLRKHTMRVHEGTIELFACDQCDFETNIKSSLKRHISAKHIEKAMKEKQLKSAILKIVHIKLC